MKILVAVDGSEHTRRLLDYLASHKDWFGSAHEYMVVHCVPHVPPGAASMLGADDLKAYYDDEGERVLGPIREFFEKHGLRAQFAARLGPAGDTIAAMAERDGFDLVMMGSHGHGAFGKLVLGSVATRVMAQCRVPVLLVR